jgi:hypothetical protein
MFDFNFAVPRLSPRLVLAALCGLATSVHAAPEADAEAIIERFRATQSAESEMAFIRMQTLLRGERVDERRFLAVYQENEDGSSDYLIRLVRPEDVEGVSVLADVDRDGAIDQSIFLPTVGKMRPLRGGAEAGAFLGSDFSYEDLLEEIPGTQNYVKREDAFVQGAPCYVVRATPRNEDSQYGFRDLYIDQETSHLLRIDYYDRNAALIKQLNCYDYASTEVFGNSNRPHRTVMTNARKGTATIFTVIVGRIGQPVAPETFTPDFIENWTSEAVEEFMFQLSFEVEGGTP